MQTSRMIIFDSDQAVRCGHCGKLIGSAEPKTILGLRELLVVLHPQCWESEAILRATALRESPRHRMTVTEAQAKYASKNMT